MFLSRKIQVTHFANDFREALELTTEQIPKPQGNQVIVKNKYVGINGLFDRAVIRDELPYRLLSPPFGLGVEAVGEVVAIGEAVTKLSIGDAVSTTRFTQAYKEYQLDTEDKIWKTPTLEAPYIALRPTAVSALVALEQVGQIREGETVAVTAAAGGLGQFVVQFAKMMNCKVVAICGGTDKVEFLNQLGCDAIIDYKNENIDQRLKEVAPKGIDLVYDTVGGQLFDTLIDHLAVRGRLVVSGYASDMGQPHLPQIISSPRIYSKIYWKAAQIRCFQNALYGEFQDDASCRILEWYRADKLKVKLDQTIFNGIESIPNAIEYHLSGQSIGKVYAQLY